MKIKTLRRALTASGKIRLVQRETSEPFVVIVDGPRQVTFRSYTQFTDAAACFSSLSGQIQQAN
jgi:hypothetical protein